MATSVQIQCINKTNRQSAHERIRGVGGIHQGSRWWMSLDNAIASIKDGRFRFWTTANGKSVWVIIATNEGREYLKTESDGLHPNNLLALPECPAQ